MCACETAKYQTANVRRRASIFPFVCPSHPHIQSFSECIIFSRPATIRQNRKPGWPIGTRARAQPKQASARRIRGGGGRKQTITLCPALFCLTFQQCASFPFAYFDPFVCVWKELWMEIHDFSAVFERGWKLFLPHFFRSCSQFTCVACCHTCVCVVRKNLTKPQIRHLRLTGPENLTPPRKIWKQNGHLFNKWNLFRDNDCMWASVCECNSWPMRAWRRPDWPAAVFRRRRVGNDNFAVNKLKYISAAAVFGQVCARVFVWRFWEWLVMSGYFSVFFFGKIEESVRVGEWLLFVEF